MSFITRDEAYTNHDTKAHVLRRVPVGDAIAPDGFKEYIAAAQLPVGGRKVGHQTFPVVESVFAEFDADSIEDAFEKVDDEMRAAHQRACEAFTSKHIRPKIVTEIPPNLRLNGVR